MVQVNRDKSRWRNPVAEAGTQAGEGGEHKL